MRYAIITGTGRSGTNWLLDTADASPSTLCRNEPHGIPGTELNRFPLVWTADRAGDLELYRDKWDEVATSTAGRLGLRDHNFRYPKDYLHPLSQRLGLTRVVTGPRARRLASKVDRRLAATEFQLPMWLGSRRRLSEALGVLKVLVDAPLVGWLMSERPQVPVVHIVRHPAGRLSSWLSRLVEPMDEGGRVRLVEDRVAKLDRIRAFDPSWADLIPEPRSLSLIEAELWFWRYANESTLEAGRGHDRYLLLRFEDVAEDPVGNARLLFDHLSLPFDEVVSRRVEADTRRSVFGAVSDPRTVASAWRTRLSPEYVDLVERVLGGTPIMQFVSGSPG